MSETGAITLFSDGSSQKTIPFPIGGGIDTSAALEIPKKATILNASFNVSTEYTNPNDYPNAVTIDVGSDGDVEWAYQGIGYGDYGRQNVFTDNNPVQSVMFESTETFKNDLSFLMPKNATVSSATLKARGAGAGKVLIVKDGSNPYGLNKIKAAMEGLGNKVNITSESKLQTSWIDTNNYKAILWIGGTSSANVPLSTFWNPFINYVKAGGHVFMCGSWIDYTGVYSGTYEIPFFEWVLHHTWGNRWGGGGSGIGTTNKYTHQTNTSHPVFNKPNSLPSYWNNLYTGTFWHSPSGTINNGSVIGRVDTTTSNPKYDAIIAWDGPAYNPSYGRTLMVRQPIAQSWFNITQGDVLTNFTENLITWFLGSGKAENVTIDIGDNGGSPEFDHSGELTDPQIVPDFTAELNNLISSTPIKFTDEYGIQFVEIPINVTNDVEGMVLLSDLDIKYNLTTLAFLNPHNDNLINELNELVPDTGEDNITLTLEIESDTAGKINISDIIIDYYLPDLTNDNLIVQNAHVPNKICYVDYENYLFFVNITNRGGVVDVNNVTLTLDTDSEQVRLHWNQGDQTFAELYDPKNLVELDTLNCQSTPTTADKWCLEFSIRFTWQNQNESMMRCSVNTTNDTGAFVFNYFEEVYRLENDLDLIGTLNVDATDQGTLIEDGTNNWVHAQETITWSNLIAVYQDTTNIYPDDKNFNITIFDDDTNKWVNSSSSASTFEIQTISDATSDYFDIHHIDITNIPGFGEDVSNWSFMIKNDNDGPQAPPSITCHADSATDPATDADDDTVIYVVWDPASDQSGSGVAEYCMGYNDNQPTDVKSSGDTAVGAEGLAVFYVRARDRVGNWGTTGSDSIMIDFTDLKYSEPIPSPLVWQNSTTVECGIMISDLGGSGVDSSSIQYRYVESGDIERGSWDSYDDAIDAEVVVCRQNITFNSDGDDKKVQWRAMDIANNIFIYSDIYSLKIDSRPVSFESFSIDFNKWHNSLPANINFYLNDTHPSGIVVSGVDVSSIYYSFSTNGIANYGQWLPLSCGGTGDSIKCYFVPTVNEGDQNFIRFKAMDIAKNQIISEDYRLKIDYSTPSFSNPIPGPEFWNNRTRLECFVSIYDEFSKVDVETIQYSISTNGTENYRSWRRPNLLHLTEEAYQMLMVSCNVTFIEGANNYIRWFALDTAGNEHISDDYRIMIDITGCTYHKPTPDPESWVNRLQVDCSIIINDTLGSGVDLSTIEYALSTDGPDNIDEWRNVNIVLEDLTADGLSIHATVEQLKLNEGTENYLYWRAKDLADSGYNQGGPYRVQIDLAPLDFYNPKPKPDIVQYESEHACQITIKDEGGSGVDPESVEFRYLPEGTLEYTNWTSAGISFSMTNEGYRFFVYVSFQPGYSNYIQWQASDMAGNGPFASPEYNIMINSPPVPVISKPTMDGDYREKINFTFDGSKSFDPDSLDILTFYWKSNLTGSISGESRFSTQLAPGYHQIILYVNDGNNHNVSTCVNITVKRNDMDNDGIADIYDKDIDGDGHLNQDDLFPRDRSEWWDSDFDYIGDNADPDDDNDGVNDNEDEFPLDGTRWENEEVESKSNDYSILILIVLLVIIILIVVLLLVKRRRSKMEAAAAEAEGTEQDKLKHIAKPVSPSQQSVQPMPVQPMQVYNPYAPQFLPQPMQVYPPGYPGQVYNPYQMTMAIPLLPPYIPSHQSPQVPQVPQPTPPVQRVQQVPGTVPMQPMQQSTQQIQPPVRHFYRPGLVPRAKVVTPVNPSQGLNKRQKDENSQ
jgi:hypothetical protein